MLTIESLKAYGADVQAGLARCMNNESFYLRLVNMELGDKNFEALDRALAAGDARAAFEAAHALKGAVGNLALTPVYEPVEKLTELLRRQETMPETGDLPERFRAAAAALRRLAEEA